MPAPKDWNKVPAGDRRRIINGTIVHRPQFPKIWQDFDELRSDFREGSAATCMMIVGETGVGKTTLVKQYADANLPERIETDYGWNTRTPVLYASLKGDSQRTSAAATILKKLLRTDTASGRISVLTDRIEAQLRKQGTELLILDEFQHLAEAGAEITRSQTADWIKGLAKETSVPIVLVGMPSLAEVVRANSQLASITPIRRELGDFNYETDRGRKAFLGFLTEVDEAYPFNGESGFGSHELAERLYLASGGNPRFLCRLLAWAAKSAIEDKAPCVQERHLEWAYDKFGGLGGIVGENPFSKVAGLKRAS